MLALSLRAVYESAVYEAELEGGHVVFRIGSAPKGVAPTATLAIVTAWNPADLRPSRAVNERANASLAAAIAHDGFGYFPALGRNSSRTHLEPSFAVVGISSAQAVAFGRRYAQAAVFFWDGAEAQVLSCIG